MSEGKIPRKKYSFLEKRPKMGIRTQKSNQTGKNSAGNYMFKVKNRNTRTKCESVVLVSLLLTLNIFHTACSSVSIVKFEQVNASWGKARMNSGL